MGDSFLNESEQDDGPFRKVKPGDRPKSILITWSDTKKGEYRRPSTKQEFMKIVGDVLEEAQDTKCGLLKFLLTKTESIQKGSPFTKTERRKL